eukprot:gene5597-6162_t
MNCNPLPEITSSAIPAHNIFRFDNGVTFSSNFDNGNLARVERFPNRPFDFKVWTAPDNMGTPHQSRHCAWFHFLVTGAPMGCVIRIQVVNANGSSGLYKHDMRPVYRSNSTNQKWVRIKSSIRFVKENDFTQVCFEHGVDIENDKLAFAFTYPYSYTQLQNELDALDTHKNEFDQPGSIFYQRELLTRSCDGRRIDLLTISSVDGMSKQEREPLLSGLFPETKVSTARSPIFANKEVVFVSARVHAGEVPAQHTFKGILSLLMDENDLVAKELRARYVFKLIPMLNPDGVFRGHFRMDQLGQNLNRYYTKPDVIMQPAIYGAKALLDYYAQTSQLAVYLDFHAHASKRGCFIYGNVLESVEDQVQNQLYCKLISMNSPHFDYEGCHFSKEHMFRIDPCDQAKGLTAEGSGRVATYLAYGLIHSYTIECNYNTSRVGNEVSPMDNDYYGPNVTPASTFTTNPEKYTPNTYATVGRACVIALLDLRGQNPHTRITKSKFKTLERVRNAVVMEVRSRREYFGKAMNRERKRTAQERRVMGSSTSSDELFIWKRVVDPDCLLVTPSNAATAVNLVAAGGGGGTGGVSSGGGSGGGATTGSNSKANMVNDAGILFISAKDSKPSRRSRPPSASASAHTSASSSSNNNNTAANKSQQQPPSLVLPLTEANLLAKNAMVGDWMQFVGSGNSSSDENAPTPATTNRQASQNNGQNGQKLHGYFAGMPKVSSEEVNQSAVRMRSLSLGRGGGRSRREENMLSSDLQSDGVNSPTVLISAEAEDARMNENVLSSRSLKTIDNAGGNGNGGNGNGTIIPQMSMARDLIREQAINKNIRVQHQYLGQGGGAGLPNREPAFSKRVPAAHKDNNRKILGKTLHAAGVALLMGSQSSSPVPPPASSSGESNSRPPSGTPGGRAPPSGIAYVYEDNNMMGDDAAGTNNPAANHSNAPLNGSHAHPLELVVTGLGSRNNSRANNLDQIAIS